MLGMAEKHKTYSRFGNKLREFRKLKGFSQFQLAIKMGKTPSAVTQYEHGRRNPSRIAVGEIAEVLKLTAAERAQLMLSAGFLPDISDLDARLDVVICEQGGGNSAEFTKTALRILLGEVERSEEGQSNTKHQ